MSRVKCLIQLISACTKQDFDKVVKSYLHEVYNYKRIVNTDGKDDTGIDLKVFDINGKANQYQNTIQKSDNANQKSKLKQKLFEDVQKAKENYEKFGYSDKLYFFYSYNLTNKSKRQYQIEAITKYNINLEIIDANQIAEESEEYIHLQEVIYNISELLEFKCKSNHSDNREECLIYDMINFGSTSDIKLSIVETYIYTILYDEKCMSKDLIIEKCIKKFNSKESSHFYDKLLQRLYSSEHEIKYDKETKNYSLTNEKRNNIEKLIGQIEIDKTFFESQIKKILKKYGQEYNLDIYINFLRKFYINSFTKRIESSDSILEVDELISFAKKEKVIHSSELAQELLKVCDTNNYLKETCASNVYSSKINIDYLQNHAKQNKFVYIDTTIALYLLCKHFEDSNDYKCYYYILSSHLFDFCKKNKITLHITTLYVKEIVSHITEAVNLIPFTNIKNFDKLGSSKNVFYNYYLFIKNQNEDVGNFGAFMKNLHFNSFDTNLLNEYVVFHLKTMGIQVIDIPKLYIVEDTIKIIEEELSEKGKNKTKLALKNDAIMLKYLADSDVDVHPMSSVFITWDRIFFSVISKFYKKNPCAEKWMQFTPSQFIDKYSLLSFSINETTITKEMLAILSGDIVNQTNSLIDSLALILNPDNEVGLIYTNRFMEMLNTKIYTTSKKSDEPQEETVVKILDIIVNKMTYHYKKNKKYNEFKILLTQKNDIDKVMEFISKNYDCYEKNEKFDDLFFADLDKMIKNRNVQIYE